MKIFNKKGEQFDFIKKININSKEYNLCCDSYNFVILDEIFTEDNCPVFLYKNEKIKELNEKINNLETKRKEFIEKIIKEVKNACNLTWGFNAMFAEDKNTKYLLNVVSEKVFAELENVKNKLLK